MRRIYLDHSATSYLREEVLSAMQPYLEGYFGNPSSIHYFGREARRALDDCRERIANCFRINPSEVVFTSGGSEADNLAIKGTAWALRERGNHIITSQIEHHAVLHSCEFLERQGFRVTYLPVDNEGFVDISALKKSISSETILISIMTANNEVGTIQDIAEIAKIAESNGIVFHTDAVQAIGHLDLKLDELPIQLVAISAHKFYGPKGVGALIVREGTKLEPLIHGGGQEWNRRAGTENLAGIVGLTKALELAKEELPKNSARLSFLRDKLIDGLLEKVDGACLNGPRINRLPNNVNIAFRGVDAQALLLQLDLAGICASSGSACTSGAVEPSHVLKAMGVQPALIRSAVRLTLGIKTTEEEINLALAKLVEIISYLRSSKTQKRD